MSEFEGGAGSNPTPGCNCVGGHDPFCPNQVKDFDGIKDAMKAQCYELLGKKGANRLSDPSGIKFPIEEIQLKNGSEFNLSIVTVDEEDEPCFTLNIPSIVYIISDETPVEGVTGRVITLNSTKKKIYAENPGTAKVTAYATVKEDGEDKLISSVLNVTVIK